MLPEIRAEIRSEIPVQNPKKSSSNCFRKSLRYDELGRNKYHLTVLYKYSSKDLSSSLKDQIKRLKTHHWHDQQNPESLLQRKLAYITDAEEVGYSYGGCE